MRDSFGRTIDYLRVSVTDRCNFRCIYCMPEEGYPVAPKEELLTFEEIARIVHISANLGIKKVRLTGGEPLLRRDLPTLIRKIRENENVTDLSCTTNGFLLDKLAEPLKEAGLHRLNVSLDTLSPEKFYRIARRGSLEQVLRGIKRAQDIGLNPIKINCVLMKGINDDEIVDFARWTLQEPIHVRFIELMPIRWNLDDSDSFDSMNAFNRGPGLLRLRIAGDDGMLNDAMMRRMLIPSHVAFETIQRDLGNLHTAEVITNGPARTYKLPKALGTIGFISQISNDLCQTCNRLRLTAEGQLRPCLMADGEVDLRTPLRNGATDREIEELILHTVERKPERHYLAQGQKVKGRNMNQLGG